jgi:hypothetical protein
MAARLLELRDPTRRIDMSRAARACAARHSLESKLLRVEEILREVAAEKRAGTSQVTTLNTQHSTHKSQGGGHS